MATLYILDYHKRHNSIHPHLTLGPGVAGPVATTGPAGYPQFYNIFNHPNATQLQHQQYQTGNHIPIHSPGQNGAYDQATPGHSVTLPYFNAAPPVVDQKGHSNTNAIMSAPSQEKVPTSNRGEYSNVLHLSLSSL